MSDRNPTIRLEGLLDSILRGAAKILGCMSANLIVFNQKTGEVRIRVGTNSTKVSELAEIETIIGNALQSMVLRLDDVGDSLVAAAWRERSCYETSTLVELVGTAFPRDIMEQAQGFLGPQRFLCVPATCGSRIFGVIVFTKEDHRPFGVQQRELLLRYAQLIGEIIDNDLRARSNRLRTSDLGANDPVEAQLLNFALSETAPALLVDPDFRITSCNEAASAAFGYSRDELIGQPIDKLFRDEKELRALLDHQFLFLSNGYFEELAVVRASSGRMSPARVKAVLLADAQDRVIGSLVLVREQAQAQDDDQAVDLLMRRERLATMGELAAQLAHEIRNPLLSIGATLESVRLDERLPADTNALLTSVAAEVDRLDTLLQDYLTLAGRRNASVSVVDLDELLRDAIRLMDAQKGCWPGHFEMTVQDGVTIVGDYDGLRHVLLNLLRNAMEACPDGTDVICRAQASSGDVSILVEDGGPGLADDPDECLQPFYSTKSNGTGMGLTVCQKIVEAHGGSISLRNREQGGCRASLFLPRKAIR